MATPIQTVDYLATTAVHGSSDTLPEVTRAVYERNLLMRSQPSLLHQRFGQQHPLQSRSGQSMVFRRYEKVALASTPLTDGVTPDGTALVKRDYVSTVKQYGNFMIISDWVDMTHVDPVISEATTLMGENMGETMDAVYREVLVAGTSAYFVKVDNTTAAAADWEGGADRTEVQGTLCKAVVDAVIRDLDGADSKHFTPIVNGSTRVNSYPLGQAYWCLMHTDQVHDLFNVAHGGMVLGEEFTPVERYSNGTGVMETEVGKYRNVRFVVSTATKIWADAGDTAGTTYRSTTGTDCDVYAALFFARDAYGVIPLQRGSATTIVTPAGGPTDPLKQRNTVGWKGAGTAIILNDTWMRRVECASLV